MPCHSSDIDISLWDKSPFWKNNLSLRETSGQFHQRVYPQLLCPQIPKAQKTACIDCLYTLLGSAGVKAACEMLVKKSPDKLSIDLFCYFVCFWGPLCYFPLSFMAPRRQCFLSTHRITLYVPIKTTIELPSS